MNPRQFESYIAKHEGLKSETSIGNIREILRIAADRFLFEARLCCGISPSFNAQIEAAKRRYLRKLPKKKKKAKRANR